MFAELTLKQGGLKISVNKELVTDFRATSASSTDTVVRFVSGQGTSTYEIVVDEDYATVKTLFA